jgi:DNA-binding winged helix-turn-helix (wHTH) protein
MPVHEHYDFGDFRVDVAERRLSKGSQPLRLEPKSYDVLLALVRRAGQLVTKRRLLDLVWPESFVEEGIVAVHVSSLRKMLGDRARVPHRFIETVPGSGYRFVATVGSHGTPPAGRRQAEVYELVQRGRSLLSTGAMSDVSSAIAAFREATAQDPTYGAAHAGLARAHCAEAQLRLRSTAEAYGDAKTAALRALAMDDSSADAQLALGTVLFLSEWNWVGAETSLSRAIELDPSHTDAYLLYGQLLEARGQLERGLEMKWRALEHDSRSAVVQLQIALSYFHQRRYDDAIDWANKTLAIDPTHLGAREQLAGAYLMKGDFDRHMAESLRHAESFGVPPEALEPLKRAYAQGGRPGAVRLAIEQASEARGAADMMLAVHYGEAGDLDAAFRHLSRAIDTHDPCLVHLAVAPMWDTLRCDPRFDECLTRMGLKEPR